MTKNEQLDQLFDNWIEQQSDYRGKFKRDGIVNEPLFDTQSKKILFICKEPNNITESPGDYREWWMEKVHLTFSIRLAEWAFGIPLC